MTLEGCQGIIRSALAILKQETRTSSHKTFSVSLRTESSNELDYRIHVEENFNGSKTGRAEGGYGYDSGNGSTVKAGGYGEAWTNPNGSSGGKIVFEIEAKAKF